MQTLLLAVLGYLFGSIPSGKIVGKFHGIDIQKHGSGNIGFANVRRTLGWSSGIAVLAADIAKGFVPVYVAMRHFNVEQPELFLIAFMPVIGHAFPVWLRFKGGKSIATSIGVLAALQIELAIVMVTLYLLMVAVFKKSAIGSLVGIWSLPAVALAVYPALFYFTLALALFATYTHRANIKEILK